MTIPQALVGRTVVVTRAASQAGDLVAALERYGATVLSCPLIEIRDPNDYARLDEAIDHLYGYDWIIFTSGNAVEFFLKRLSFKNVSYTELDEIKVAAIGDSTAEKLRDAYVHVDLVPSLSKSEGVLSALVDYVGGDEHLQGLNFLMPRATVGRDYLPKALEAANARVDVVATYQNVIPDNLDRGKFSAMLAGGADCIAFTSSSTVKNLALLFDTNDLSEKLQGLTIACLGDVTAATAKRFGLEPTIQPWHSTMAEFAAAIASHFEEP
ncbi:MAG TPA: uroporphyrinogen-III synthase [Pyrinomonadaceae bacterium]|nr:uroporphyrinogen-III synthase [Pyrinomonadaceae bacterium]